MLALFQLRLIQSYHYRVVITLQRMELDIYSRIRAEIIGCDDEHLEKTQNDLELVLAISEQLMIMDLL